MFGLTFSIHQNGALVRRETRWEDIVKVGRDAKAHLRIDDERASRLHAIIEVASPSDITLVDLGSEAGTIVDGARVNKCKIRPGEHFQIGSTRIELVKVEPWAAAGSAAPPGEEVLRTMILDHHPHDTEGLRALGYWAPPLDLPQVHHFVDASWDANERDAVFAYLHLGEVVRLSGGYSWCRFNCGLVERGFEPITDEDIDQLFSDEEEPPGRTSDPSPATPISLSELLREIRAKPETMGSTCLSDGHFIWPVGLAHYVDKHLVRPPEEFVRHALQQLLLRGIR